MISPNKLLEMSRKWRKIAAGGRKSISFRKTDRTSSGVQCAAEKGHFVVYSNDQKRFVIPLKFINCKIFQELFKMSEDEFGLSSDGPIMFPCDSSVMDYILSLIQRGVAENLERALIYSIRLSRCSFSDSHQEPKSRHFVVSAY